MTKKYIFFDIDGTLTKEKDIADDVITKLLDISMHATITFITGRTVKTFSNLKNIPDLINIPYALMNGSIICDKSGQIIAEHHIPKSYFNKVFKYLRNNENTIFHLETKNGIYVTNPQHSMWDWARRDNGNNFFGIEKYNNDPVYKLTLHLHNKEIDVSEIKKINSDGVLFKYVDANYIDIAHPNSHKGTAIRLILNRLKNENNGISTIVCGDAWNDVPMLKCADISICLGDQIDEHMECDIKVDSTDELLTVISKIVKGTNN